VQVYNEHVFDLLAGDGAALTVRHHSEKDEFFVPGLLEVSRLLKKKKTNRQHDS